MKPIIGKDTFPTAYGFACGYVKVSSTDRYTVKTWHENGCFHVRAHDFYEHERVEWLSFNLMSEAKKAHRAICRKLHIQL